MPAEIDTGGHRVLHCDSHADCPTALSIHVSSLSSNDRCRTVNLSVRIDDDESNESKRRAPRDRPRRTGNCVRKAEPLDYERGSPSSNHDGSSPTRVPRIGDKEETIQEGRDFLTKSGALTQPSHWRREGRGGRGDEVEDGLLGACRVSRKFPCANEDVTKDESSSVTWDSREDTGDGIGRAESRLRDETERYRLAIADTTKVSLIAKHRSLRDRSRTRLRPSSYGSKPLDTDPTEVHHPRTAGGNSLLSSHHSRTRANEETYEDDYKDVDERFLSEKFNNDTRTNENERLDGSGRRDEHSESKRNKRLGQDSTYRKPISRVCFFLQLALLLFFIAFGRYGLLGSSSVFRVSARPITNGLSVLGIIGAVNARSIDLIGDAGTRAERSANLSHITGTSRKIQMYIMNRHLQILPDGTVNGAKNDSSIYTIVQRLSTGKGKINIQGIATCLFVCMDVCGLLYGARNATKECEFNENLEQHNYNTYSSVRWSTAKKTLYIGLKSNGESKKVQVRGQLGKLSTNVRVLTQVISLDRLETMLNQHKVRHHCHHRRQVCDGVAQPLICSTPPPREKDGRDRFRCRKRKKRRKRKRRCRSGEQPGPQCQVPEESIESVTNVETSSEMISANSTTPESKRSCEGAASEEACRRQALSVPAKKRKSRIDGGGRNLTLNGKNKAPTSNAKKPNISVADSQSKKPDLTDGKKKKKKRTGPQQTSRWSTVASPSRKRYGPGTTSSSRTSSSLTAPVSEEQRASTATLFSSPSPPGASTALFSIRRPSSSPFDRKKPSPSSRNHLARPMGSRKIEKLSPGNHAGLPVRPRSIPAISTTSRSEIASPASITKVPEDRCTYTTTPLPQFSPVPSSSSLLWQEESDEDSSSSLSYSSLVDEESSSTVTSELAIVTVESSTLAAFDEVVAEATTSRLDEKNYEDGDFDMADTIPRTTTRLPLERLAM